MTKFHEPIRPNRHLYRKFRALKLFGKYITVQYYRRAILDSWPYFSDIGVNAYRIRTASQQEMPALFGLFLKCHLVFAIPLNVEIHKMTCVSGSHGCPKVVAAVGIISGGAYIYRMEIT